MIVGNKQSGVYPAAPVRSGLERFDARKAKVVELRFFGGLSVEETAEVLKISPQSVMRWKLARAWLMRELSR
jgi:DNA-directed RNA polymerase specialized sigma24 family protein